LQQRTQFRRRPPTRPSLAAAAVLFAFGVVTLVSVGPAGARLAAPVPLAPGNGVTTDGLPPFAWKAVANAEQYEFEIAADRGFNSPVLGRGQDSFLTKNTRATLKKTVPNGTYWWHVRAITAGGATSPWSAGRSFRKLWAATTNLQSPASGGAVVYPTTPLRLSWTPVPGARKYLVSIAYDPALGSLVPGTSPTAGPAETTATTFTRAAALAPGTYYWGVTPVDAEGNRGVRSQVSSFTWVWPSTTTPRVTDLNPGPEVFDPQFSWDLVRGAARYEVEVSSSQDFAPGSKVCCAGTTIGLSLSPTTVLKDNTYYWRVRALDVDGNAGDWNFGPSFTKTFDNVPPVAGTSIKNLHMRDNATDPGTDLNPATTAYETQTPIVSWDPVPGASSYQVEVTPFEAGDCNWTSLTLPSHHWKVTTAVTAWSPLGVRWNFQKPFGNPNSVAIDSAELAAGAYCIRVRARSNRAGLDEIVGDYTYLKDGAQASANSVGPAFTWTGYLSTGFSGGCNSGYLCAGDYFGPTAGPASCVAPPGGAPCVTRTPLFRWRPLPRRAWVALKNAGGANAILLVAKGNPPVGNTYYAVVRDYAPDPSRDEMLLFDPAMSPSPVENYNYPDGNLGDLAAQVNASPSRVTASVVVGGVPLAHIASAPFNLAVESYFVIVAKDPTFTNITDYAFTQVPAYAPRSLAGVTTYPDETTSYYWVVLPATAFNGSGAKGDPLQGAVQAFHKRSTPPAQLQGGSAFRWTPTEGARRYRLQVSQDASFGALIDDVTTDSTAYTSNTTYPADTALYWRVRADDENLVGLSWSATGAFRKTLPTPQLSPNNPAGGDFIPTWSWAPVDGAVGYDVSADLPDGTHREITGLRTPVLTPVLMYGTGIFSWRVRAVFPKNPFGTTPGPYTATHTFARTIGEPTGARTDAAIDHVLMSWNSKPQVKGYEVQISGQPSFAQPIEIARTDNTSYASPLKFPPIGRFDTGHFYWRVAAVDEGNNLGDFTRAQEVKRTRRMTIVLNGRLRRRRTTFVMVSVKNFESGAGVAGVGVRISGAGMRARRVRTPAGGTVMIRVRPRRRGVVVFRATARGYRTTSISVRVH
jgi:hypothetical protein